MPQLSSAGEKSETHRRWQDYPPFRVKTFAKPPLLLYLFSMSTVQEIEDAIRALPASERDKLMRDIPNLFPEFADEEWQRIIN